MLLQPLGKRMSKIKKVSGEENGKERYKIRKKKFDLMGPAQREQRDNVAVQLNLRILI